MHNLNSPAAKNALDAGTDSSYDKLSGKDELSNSALFSLMCSKHPSGKGDGLSIPGPHVDHGLCRIF